MRIGILTYHRAYNYGAVLQCYALQQYLISQGHDVEVIDYRQCWIDAFYKPFSICVLKYYINRPKAIVRYIFSFFRRTKVARNKHFESFRSEFIKQSSCPVYTMGDIPDNYDAYIIGSDQLWGKGCMANTLDSVYLGNFSHINGAIIIGYAISSDRDSIKKLYDENRLKKSLNNFLFLSFRESSISRYIQTLTGISYPVTIDPTLLLDEEIWEPLINKKWEKKNFVAIYQVRGGRKNKYILYHKAKLMAKMFGNCPIIDLSDMYFSVTDFLSIIKYAKFVVTSSFHATVFSIIFKTPFYAIKHNDSKDHRYVYLCSALGLEKQCIDKDYDALEIGVDFANVDTYLGVLRQHSIDFLATSLL